MNIEFLDLGRQPIVNNFLAEIPENEYFFNLKVGFDSDTYLVSLLEQPDKRLLFNDSYVYTSSQSTPMVKHFKDSAHSIKMIKGSTAKILEIGSNDGIFLKNFNPSLAIGVEPCGNFAKITNDLGYKTYNDFWSIDLARKIVEENGKFDCVFAANCISHIPDIDKTIKAIKEVLNLNGILVIEDPSLLQVLINCSYDQIYDEHVYIFSTIGLDNVLNRNGFYINDVVNLPVHGGTNRYIAGFSQQISQNAIFNLSVERLLKLNKLETYYEFADKVIGSKILLQGLLQEIKNENKKIISYGATGKSSIVFNYCNIGTDIIDYITDTTPSKQGKFSPGKHIPVISPEEGFNNSVDYTFLGAWNFKDAIIEKEKNSRTKWITHVPIPRIIM